MAPTKTQEAVLAELVDHPRGDDLARLVHTIAFAAADERRTQLSDGLAEAAERMGISARDADTTAGNVLVALERSDVEGAASSGAVLLGALLARGVALSPPEGAAAEARVLETLVWIATHTPVDALPALDAAMGDRAAGLWRAAGGLVRRVDAGSASAVGRAGAIIAAAALRASDAAAAHEEVSSLAGEVRDPVVRSILGGLPSGAAAGGAGDTIAATGEIVPAPHGPVAFVLLAFTGVLAVLHVGRLIGRWVLRYRRPAELRVSPKGVTVLAKTEMLGRTLSEQELHFPVESLLRATREVRFPRLAMYAGLFALAAGSYFGIALFVDGARAGSPELLGIGALIVAIGVALDFALVSLTPRGRGRSRLIVAPRKGRAIALDRIDTAAADAALRKLIQRA
jgi:hypothetical protein